MIYLEVYKPATQIEKTYADSTIPYEKVIENVVNKQNAIIDWSLVDKVISNPTGIPIQIGYLEKNSFSIRNMFR